jgi:hypothetical protein
VVQRKEDNEIYRAVLLPKKKIKRFVTLYGTYYLSQKQMYLGLGGRPEDKEEGGH